MVTSKIIEKLNDDFFSNKARIFINKNFNFIKFFSDEMGIFSTNRNNINLDDVNFHKNIIHIRLMTRRNGFKQHKSFKK